MTSTQTEVRSYIAGHWSDNDGPERQRLSPADQTEVTATYRQATAANVADAIAAAADAFPIWSQTPIATRAACLDAIGDRIARNAEDLAVLVAREQGKTRRESLGEAMRASAIFKFFAGEAVRTTGEVTESLLGTETVEITREPLGPIGLICPWNFPLALTSWKIAPALAFGDTVVFKPAELTPSISCGLADIIAAGDLPAGAFNLVLGSGSVVGEAIVNAPELQAISFTGSNAVGRRIAATCASRGARVQCEMGGKNPLVVLDDADLDLAVRCAVDGAFYQTGQRCTASSRLIVTASVHDDFVERLVKRTSELTVGHPLDPASDIGPVVDSHQFEQDLSYVEIARQEGAQVAFGGDQPDCGYDGFYLRPTILVNATPEMRSSREEIFGPVASVLKVEDYDHALECANDTEYGLTAGIITDSLSRARHFQRHARAGVVAVNRPTSGIEYHAPFGGRRSSSYGPPELGRYARDFYTAIKTTYIA